MDTKDLTSTPTPSWFETDRQGVLRSLHWEQPPLPLKPGQSIAPLFEEAPHQLSNLFSQLSTRNQVSLALPCRRKLLLLRCKKNRFRCPALGGGVFRPSRSFRGPQ